MATTTILGGIVPCPAQIILRAVASIPSTHHCHSHHTHETKHHHRDSATLSTSRAPTGLVGRAPGKPNKKTTQRRVPWPFAAAQSGRLDVYQVPDSDVPPPPLPSFSEHHESLARWPDHAAQ